MPSFTVITPTYNRKVLGEAIESVLRQTFRDFEYLIVDDGSTDDTRERILPYLEDDRVTYHHQENQGVYAALNQGIREAKGEYLSFLDSDDLYLPHHLSQGVAAFKEDPSLDFVLSPFLLEVPNPDVEYRVADFFNPETTIPLTEVQYLTGSLIARKSVLQEASGFPNHRFPDAALLHSLTQGPYRWKRLERPSYTYRFSRCPNSLSQQLLPEKIN